ncbi:hypothetical protein ACFFX0_14955 [Citricoccus parietis]|uniref:Uncharacterized protein n=1 Tax=Citricoccus parietis TaxID=592307 RepID=A0ABV5G0G3_9MICC
MKASTRTNPFGSSTLRDHSNQRLPSSARVADVNSATESRKVSVYSGLTWYLTTMKIMGPAYPARWTALALSSAGTDPSGPRSPGRCP